MKVEFFNDKLVEAIGAGIYGIYLNNKRNLLYIGESVFVMARCSAHLYEIQKGTGYLGFTNEINNNDNFTLIFDLLDSISDTESRKKREKELIKSLEPKQQSGISDRVKSVEEMMENLKNLLDE